MPASYVIRLDDISRDMNYENFSKMRDLLSRHGVRPLMGVIPCNKDKKIAAAAVPHTEEQFWDLMRQMQALGWEVALHGYDHIYTTKKRGLFSINRYSEFAGVPYPVQLQKIQDGLAVLRAQNITPVAFMAPAHTLDRNTLRALRSCGLCALTDGCGIWPYTIHGLRALPQRSPGPYVAKKGVHTFCFHINHWEDAQFDKLDAYLQAHASACIPFTEALKLPARPLSNRLHAASFRFSRALTHNEKLRRILGKS